MAGWFVRTTANHYIVLLTTTRLLLRIRQAACVADHSGIEKAQPLELSVRGSLGGPFPEKHDRPSLEKVEILPLPSRPDAGAGASLQIDRRQTIANIQFRESEKGLHLYCICAAPHSASGPQLRLCRSRPAHLPRSNWGLTSKRREREKKRSKKKD